MKKWLVLAVSIIIVVGVSLSPMGQAWWKNILHPTLTWEELRPYAEEEFPELGIVFFWQELDDVGYAVIGPDIKETDTFAHLITWVIINGRASGLERVVIVTALEGFGSGHFATGYVQAVGKGLENWPKSAATSDGMGEWLRGEPYGTGAYLLPYYMQFPISEVEEAFASVLEISEYMNDFLVNR